jgi:phosphopantothenoylcysteine synthetase/decarboxylase
MSDQRSAVIVGDMPDHALGLIVSGSSASIGLPAYLMYLRHEADLSLRILLTHSAERFLSRQAVAWYADEVYRHDDEALNPTEFARRCAGLVVLPATANMLSAAALGLAATPAQTAILAADQPALFFPAMNAAMWGKPIIQRHVAALRGDGHMVIEPQPQQVYEFWRRDFVVGPAMPPPDVAIDIIITWLEHGELAAAEPDTAELAAAEPDPAAARLI